MSEEVSHEDIYDRQKRLENDVGELTTDVAILKQKVETAAEAVERNHTFFSHKIGGIEKDLTKINVNVAEHRAEFKTMISVLGAVVVVGLSAVGILVSQ